MLGIGFGEFALVLLVLIVVLGPERLPVFMKAVGKGIRTLRNASRDIRSAVGIDELMREDVVYKPPAPRRPEAPRGEAPISRNALPEPPPSLPEAVVADATPTQLQGAEPGAANEALPRSVAKTQMAVVAPAPSSPDTLAAPGPALPPSAPSMAPDLSDAPPAQPRAAAPPPPRPSFPRPAPMAVSRSQAPEPAPPSEPPAPAGKPDSADED